MHKPHSEQEHKLQEEDLEILVEDGCRGPTSQAGLKLGEAARLRALRVMLVSLRIKAAMDCSLTESIPYQVTMSTSREVGSHRGGDSSLPIGVDGSNPSNVAHQQGGEK